MGKKEKYLFILSLLAVPVIIYFYFLKWKTTTMYGDDLYQFKGLSGARSFSDVMRISTDFSKYRPIFSCSSKLIFDLFYKNLTGYYLFNILIQTINTYLVALIVNLFLRSPIISVAFSLLYGLSRLSFFVISQLFNGGALEGLAISFFLLCLFFLLDPLIKNNTSNTQTKRSLLWSILFANLCICTHERYIVILPFIMFVILFFPALKRLNSSQRMLFSSIALASIFLNVAIKKYFYHMPFFVGTGGTHISFSFSSAITYFTQGILSIIQINSGPEYLIGIPFSSLEGFNLILPLSIACSAVVLFTIFFLLSRKAFVLKQEDQKNRLYIFLFLFALMGILLIPAVVTIRLEQRWLQASFSVFLVLIVIAFTSVQYKHERIKYSLLFLFMMGFLFSDANYFYKGVPNLYMTDAQKTAANFEKAINNGTIHPNTSQLYIWEKHVDANSNGGINWALAEGYLFKYYQGKSKELFYIDSTYREQQNTIAPPLSNFNKDSAQIIYIKDGVMDITEQYLKDSLKNFSY